MNTGYLNNVQLVAEKIIQDVAKRVQESETKQFTDEDLLALHSVYGPVLQRALDIFEKHPSLETYSTSKSRRVLIEIKGENSTCYRIFRHLNFCPCKAFKHQVLEKKSQVTCKHVLVGRIACILNKTVNKEVTEEQYLMLVKSMFVFEQNG